MKKKQVVCERCHYAWVPRPEKKPVSCPKCKRYDWDKKKKRNNRVPARELSVPDVGRVAAGRQQVYPVFGCRGQPVGIGEAS